MCINISTHRQDISNEIFFVIIISKLVVIDGRHCFKPGADFTKGLKSRFRLKFKTLVLNFVNRMLSLWS